MIAVMPIATHRLKRGASGFVALVLGWICLACGDGDPRPSIVLVTLDTLRRDHVGVYGSDRGLTPHLDALARDGIVYDAAYTTMPTTSPAHASLMTGLEPFQHGVRRNGVALTPPLRSRVLAERLRGAGYATGAFVTTRLLAESVTGFDGFDRYVAPKKALWSGSNAVAAALRWLEEEPRRPFFLWLHIYDPHSPYGDADDKGRSYPVDPRIHGFVDPARFAEEDRSRMAALYAKGVRAADAALGELLAGVRARDADPLILVVADHGESLDEWLAARGYAYDHGEFLEEEEIRIPLVIAGPGVTPGRSSALASIRDLYTTLLVAAGVGDPEAGSAGRRDLRRATGESRFVAVERRQLFKAEVHGVSASRSEVLRLHALAVTDGSNTVVLDVAGQASSPGPSPPELLEAAHRRWSHIDTASRASPSPRIDASTRDALRALGYADPGEDSRR
jgi:arylsulfatase A-like enzyme